MLEADVCVVGSGAGGGLIAGVLAQAGLDVVVLEAGGNFNEPDFSGLELPAFQQLFWRGGPTPTRRLQRQPAGRLHARRRADRQLVQLPAHAGARAGAVGARIRPRGRRRAPTSTVTSMLSGRDWGSTQRCSDLNGPHQRMRDGAAALGWSFKTLSRNADPAAYSPDTAGYIGIGDRSGAKLDVRRTYLRDACQAGARVIVRCRAERVLTEDGRAAGVQAACADPRTGASASITVRAPRVVVACGSLESPALLLRSGIGGPAVGRYLHLHPVVAFLGLHAEPQRPWWGAPMTAMVDEFADIEDGYGFLLQGAQWATSIVAGGVARASGAELKETMARLENAAWFIGLQRDRGHGTVTIDAAGNAVVRYALDRRGRRARRARARSRPRFGFTPPAEPQEIVPFAATTTRWRRGDDLEAFITRCSESRLRRWRPPAVLGPPDEQLPNGCGPGDLGRRTRGASCTTRPASTSATQARCRLPPA